jgi:glyceraldehyde 3-phosphate dehydrogenase (phosphorylating)
MSNKRVAINGFGRIGRLTLRAFLEAGRKDLDFVAINDLGSADMNAHLLEFDSVHGRFLGKVRASNGHLKADGHDLAVLSEATPEKLPWRDLGIDIVMECTGRFTNREGAAKHLIAGAKRVLVSAPCNDADLTVVYGVNDERLTQEHHVVSNASCTTNCLAPVASVLNQAIGIRHGYMTTIHAYTGDQRTVDTLHKDPFRARAAALNLIPTSTGAAKAVGLVLPELKGKLDGAAIRVPVPNVSLIDLTFTSSRPTSVEEINRSMIEAAKGPLKGVLGVNAKPLVSTDFNHDPLSSIFDLESTEVVDGTFCRVVSWYDNEWGFSNRMNDTAAAMGRLI